MIETAAPARVAWRGLGTGVSVLVTRAACLPDARAVVERVLAETDLAASRFRDDSELVRVNREPGRWHPVSVLFLEIVRAALRAARVTAGAVDPTIGRALALAGYDRDFSELVSMPVRRIRFVETPGWRSVEVDRGEGRIRVPRGVELDLGATGKAFAADSAARRAAAVVGAGVLVNLGGDIAVCGPPPAGGWAVRVTDDHAGGPGAPGQTVSIRAGGVATSSTTVRRWRTGDRCLHHIFDPRTGRPAAGPWDTVSAAAANCVDANTASTAAIVRGGGAPAWLEAIGLPARLVRRDGGVIAVGGWPAEEAR